MVVGRCKKGYILSSSKIRYHAVSRGDMGEMPVKQEGAAEKQTRWTRRQLQVLLLLQLIFVIDGIDTQILAVALPAIVADWRLPLADFGIAMAAGHAGAFVGTPIAGILGDRFGRKPVLVGGTLLFSMMTLALAMAREPTHLAGLRFVAGLGLGGCIPPALALLTESMPGRRRGLCVALSMVCPPIGIALAGLLAKWLIPALGWGNLFMLCGMAPLAAAVLLFLFLSESPAYLALKGDRPERLAALLAALNLPAPAENPGDKDPGLAQSLSTIFAVPRRTAVLGLFLAFFFIYLAMSLVLGWLPSMLASNGYSLALASTSTSVFALAGIIGVLLTGWAIVARGERVVANALMAGGITIALLLSIGLPPPAAFGSASAMLLFGLLALEGMAMNGLITALYTGASGTFPPRVRSSGIGLASTLGRLGAMCGGLIGPLAIGHGGVARYCLVLGGLLLFAALGFNLRKPNQSQSSPPGRRIEQS
ncbi:putative aromatic acid transporter [Sphingobium sp. SYK-6]|nr:putative aromatic acid transporter [Sphingobium sp. SYK-6]